MIGLPIRGLYDLWHYEFEDTQIRLWKERGFLDLKQGPTTFRVIIIQN